MKNEISADSSQQAMASTEYIIRHLLQTKTPIVLVLNKIDRLILELRLPPNDAYYKLKQTIEEVNTVISAIDPSPELRLSPEKGNVAFASTQMGWCFTLESFAKMYRDVYGQSTSALSRHILTSLLFAGGFDVDGFSQRLWGNIFFNPDTRKFTRKEHFESVDVKRSFVQFILEPLYKIYTQTISADAAALRITLKKLGIVLKPASYKLDVKPLLKLVLTEFFGPSSGLIDMVAAHIPDPSEASAQYVALNYTGPLNTELATSMIQCNAEGPLVVHVTKLYPSEDAQEFHAFGRVLSGTVRPGSRVKVLGENYSAEDEEDMVVGAVEKVFVSEARYAIGTDGIPAGNFVLMSGVDNSITKTATLIDAAYSDSDLCIFRPLKHMTQSVVKIAVEPVNPSELPKMLDGLRKINKTYPLVETKVEESGEHVIIGTGELYLDCLMYDLRRTFAEIEIKLSDPVTRFCETVVETSALKCYAETPNKK